MSTIEQPQQDNLIVLIKNADNHSNKQLKGKTKANKRRQISPLIVVQESNSNWNLNQQFNPTIFIWSKQIWL